MTPGVSPVAVSAFAVLLLILSFPIACRSHQCEDDPSEDPVTQQKVPRMAVAMGGAVDVAGSENSLEVEELARFAVDEHNKKENALLQFSRVMKAKQQVVSGVMHHLTVEVIDGGKKNVYEAQVWVQAWLNSKKLHEFKHVGDAPQ